MDLKTELQQHLGDDFHVERELGGGGMSRVFVAEEVRLSRRVVVKVLSPELSEGLNAERFEREILLAASLQQANIVPVLAAGRVGRLPYFMMPFVEGESLRNKLGAGGMSVSEVVSILRDVSKALSYAHARGIVHRDIKPDNVLLSGGTAVVTDFGIAKALSASRTDAPGGTLTQVGTSIGTPAYMAPEQVAGDPNIDQRVDLYSLGAMAFELLTGRPPFADLTPQKMLAAHLSEVPASVRTLRPDTPSTLVELVASLLEKDPERRTQTAADVTRVLDETSTSSQPTGALEGPGSLARAIGMWGVATGAAWILAKAATVGIGLPEWVVPGALIVMGLGLPALLLTAWVRRTAFRAATATPTMTPGGSIAPPSGTMTTMALKASPHVTWRKTARGGAFAMGGFVLVVAVFMALRSFGIGSAGSLFAKGMMSADDRIVLASLDAADEDTAFASVVGVALREAMSQSKSIRLMSRTEVASVLEEMERDRDEAVTGEIASEVAQRGGAKAILGGRLARVGSNGYAITLELKAASDGALLAAYPGTADGPSEVLETVDKLARRLRGKVGESLRDVAATIPLKRATTGSFEALQKYNEASLLNDINYDFDAAAAAAREAVALDSTFALAWRKLAVALNNGSGSNAERDSAATMAFRLADRLHDRERLAAEGAYYLMVRDAADRGKEIDAYLALLEVDSSNTIALTNLALRYGAIGMADSAAEFGRRILNLPGEKGFAVNSIVGAMLVEGRFEDASRFHDSVVAGGLIPAGGDLDRIAGTMINWAAGRFSEEDSVYQAMMSESSTGIQISMGFLAIGDRGAKGKARDALDAIVESNRILGARGAQLFLPELDSAIAFTLGLGNPTAGLELVGRALASNRWVTAEPVDRPYLNLIAILAQSGDTERAHELFDEYLALDPSAKAPRQQASISWLRGTLARTRGDHQTAIPEFRAALVGEDERPSAVRPFAWLGLAQAFDELGQSDSVAAALEQYLALPVTLRGASDPYYLAPSERRLGELYDANGETAKAIEMYGRFVNRWRDADEELQPTVSSVRARLTELQQQEAP